MDSALEHSSIDTAIALSIIIPVYNAEKYLEECLDSIINQTFKNIEIICINDGSSDNSLKILEKYEKKDKRFTVISQKNCGVSTARNVGIKHAKGEYIMFVDSDDWLLNTACEKAYCTIKDKNCDMLLFSHFKFNNQSCVSDGRLQKLYLELQDKCTTFEESTNNLVFSPCMTSGKIYKLEFLKKHNITFLGNIQYGEDLVFYINACVCAKSIYILFEHLYYYRENTQNSLSKNSKTTLPHLYKAYIAVRKILQKADLKDFNKIHAICLNRIISLYLWQWNSIHNRLFRTENLKYLYKIIKECKKVPKEYREYLTLYERLKQTVKDFRTLFLRKLFEPLFELEKRNNRIVIYLFERQRLNFSTLKLDYFIFSFRYFCHLIKLRFVSKFRKIRVGFWVTESEKWSSNASIYKALSDSKNFEPFVMLANFRNSAACTSLQEHMQDSINFFKDKDVNFIPVYDIELNKHLELKKFKPDIVFYQQPWQIHFNQNLLNTSKTALICYAPYCYYSLNSYFNYLLGFHGKLWKYFVESEMHKLDYKKEYNAKNCAAVGSCKLDNYKILDEEKINKIWKTTNKKRIIYSPHHGFDQGDQDYTTATFDKNGDFILKLAKSHPEFEWIFRPHPVFKDRVIRYGICSLAEIDNYFAEWEKIGTIYTEGDYYEMFKGSDCLITDCISFLSEYLPTEKPVIHLRKNNQKESFNSLLKLITNDYYKVYDNETLLNVFNEVIVNGNDYLKEKRIKNIKLLMIEENKTTGEKIKEYLEKELWLKR